MWYVSIPNLLLSATNASGVKNRMYGRRDSDREWRRRRGAEGREDEDREGIWDEPEWREWSESERSRHGEDIRRSWTRRERSRREGEGDDVDEEASARSPQYWSEKDNIKTVWINGKKKPVYEKLCKRMIVGLREMPPEPTYETTYRMRAMAREDPVPLMKAIALSDIPGFKQHWKIRDDDRHRVFTWVHNGCSWSPDRWFKDSCQIHDFGYRNYKKFDQATSRNRQAIDENFKRNMKSQCGRRDFFCKTLANTYYVAVRKAGGPAFGSD